MIESERVKDMLKYCSDETMGDLDVALSSLAGDGIWGMGKDLVEMGKTLTEIMPICSYGICDDDCPFFGDDGPEEKICGTIVTISKTLNDYFEEDEDGGPVYSTENHPNPRNVESSDKDALRIHEVKSWPQYFQPVLLGKKIWEYRINDRDYKVGDLILMREWVNGDFIRADRETRFTGKWVLAEISSVHGGLPGMAEGYCILNIFVHEVGTNGRELAQTLDNLGDYQIMPIPPEK